MGLHNALPWCEPTYTTHLVASQLQGQKENCSEDGYTWTLLTRWSDPSIRNRVLFYKKLNRHMMVYACPVWRFAASTYVLKLQVYKLSVFALPWVPPSKLVTGKSRGFGCSSLCWPHQISNCELRLIISWSEETHISVTLETPTLTEGWPPTPDREAMGGSVHQGSQRYRRMTKLTNRSQHWSAEHLLDAFSEVFLCFFLSHKTIARVHNAKLWHSPPLPHQAGWLHRCAYQQILISSLGCQYEFKNHTANQSNPPPPCN